MSTKKTVPSLQDPFLSREAQKYEAPIPSREFILSTLAAHQESMTRSALMHYFELEGEAPEEALRRRLKAMVRDGQLLKTPQGLIPVTEPQLCHGILIMEREGEGILRSEKGQTILLGGATLRGYYDGDEIEVQITQIDRRGNARGRIVRLLTATTPKVIGRFVDVSRKEVIPFDRKFTRTIFISSIEDITVKEGDIVQVEIIREDSILQHQGKIIEVLGDFSTPGIEINMAMRKFNLSHEWPLPVLKACHKWHDRALVYHEEKKRKDLRSLGLVTIDGEDAKDFDDAVFCEKKKEGGWRLWAAIADVSHYVVPGSALDKEAYERGNSTYFPGCVIPMLPEVLSNELCSLKPNMLRLCMVCQMSIDAQGEIVRTQFYRAWMCSQARLTYTEVAQIIEGNSALREKYAVCLSSLEALHELYHAFYRQRKKRGAIDFETTETRILFDKSGKIKSIVPQVRTVAHKMIEESMLAANVCAAKFLSRHKKATLFRVHERPPQDKLTALRQFLSELGLDLPGRQEPGSKDFSKLVAQIQHREDRHIIEMVMLRSLSQAQYHPENKGHFGLAYSGYLHFTSPIRRYPDLIVHRMIGDVLDEKGKKDKKSDLALEKIGRHCSETERRSDEATRDAVLSLKCHYMQDKVGQHFRGIISGVASFGIFIELKDIYVEGLVHVTALGNEYFYYDPAHHRMVGEATRTVYRLGDPLEVKVVRVDVEAKKIDLELLKPSRVVLRKASAKTRKSRKGKAKRTRK